MVTVETQDADLGGDLVIPRAATSIVLFAHGSGSSRFSPRNRHVARLLNEAGLATLLVDLLTPAEEREDEVTAEFRFNIQLLAERLAGATEWLGSDRATAALHAGYFGASTGAAAALVAAARLPAVVEAVVSRGGRPDLAGPALEAVRAPTLLVVGGDDTPVLELNREALARLSCEKRLEIVPGASHLFEEPGTLDAVAHLARGWFLTHLGQGVRTEPTSASRA